jgi:hypothetical protein
VDQLGNHEDLLALELAKMLEFLDLDWLPKGFQPQSSADEAAEDTSTQKAVIIASEQKRAKLDTLRSPYFPYFKLVNTFVPEVPPQFPAERQYGTSIGVFPTTVQIVRFGSRLLHGMVEFL